MQILGANPFDLLFFILVVYFVYSSHNFIYAALDLAGFVLTIFFSYKYYILFSNLFIILFSMSKGISQALGFFVAWLVFEAILFVLSRLVLKKLPKHLVEHSVNRLFAFAPAVIQGCIFYMFIVVTIFSLPVKPAVKEDLLHSRTGPSFIGVSHILEGKIKSVFGGAVNETLNFVTIRNQNNETIDLGFKASSGSLKVDAQSEAVMLSLINRERKDIGLSPLTMDSPLQLVARGYAEEMLENGFFSHDSRVDGSAPAQRADRKGISYGIIGENLAFAPDVYLAHQGLMNSPGHRANILSTDYHKVGIGIIDAGTYGRMFVQEFSD